MILQVPLMFSLSDWSDFSRFVFFEVMLRGNIYEGELEENFNFKISSIVFKNLGTSILEKLIKQLV